MKKKHWIIFESNCGAEKFTIEVIYSTLKKVRSYTEGICTEFTEYSFEETDFTEL